MEAAESQQNALQAVQSNEAISSGPRATWKPLPEPGTGRHPSVMQHEVRADYLTIGITWPSFTGSLTRECETSELMVVIDQANTQYPDLKDTIFREAAEASAKLCAAASSDETEMLESLDTFNRTLRA